MSFTIIIFFWFISFSCQTKEDQPKSEVAEINYQELVDQVKEDSQLSISDSANFLDKNIYDPSRDSMGMYFDSLEHIYTKDSAMVKQSGINDSGELNKSMRPNEISNASDSFSNNIKKINIEEIRALKYNLDQLHKRDTNNSNGAKSCKQIDCRIWARINKTNQQLYLYIDGKMVDSFKTSTGDKKHETPIMDRRPSGPSFQKYTSKKFPGGNYNGLGNMPYVVFIRGGYAIHGTTKGNIPKLGKKASHGCIRLHPDNAKIF
jgi:hypothetical protein